VLVQDFGMNGSTYDGFLARYFRYGYPILSEISNVRENSENIQTNDKNAQDLMDKLLILNYNQRITAREALTHDYFRINDNSYANHYRFRCTDLVCGNPKEYLIILALKILEFQLMSIFK
jgi:serine/threonine protein kinase